MDKSKRCRDCEWWDHPGDGGDLLEGRRCLRWVQYSLRTGAEDRCWQWAAKGMNEFKVVNENTEKIAEAKPLGVIRLDKPGGHPDEQEEFYHHVGRRLSAARQLLQKVLCIRERLDNDLAEDIEIWLQGE